jgi:hypothetical protein
MFFVPLKTITLSGEKAITSLCINKDSM